MFNATGSSRSVGIRNVNATNYPYIVKVHGLAATVSALDYAVWGKSDYYYYYYYYWAG